MKNCSKSTKNEYKHPATHMREKHFCEHFGDLLCFSSSSSLDRIHCTDHVFLMIFVFCFVFVFVGFVFLMARLIDHCAHDADFHRRTNVTNTKTKTNIRMRYRPDGKYGAAMSHVNSTNRKASKHHGNIGQLFHLHMRCLY